MTSPMFCSEWVFGDIKTYQTNSHWIHFVVDQEDLFLQIGIRASIFLNYKHKMCLEYIPKLFHNQMGAMNLWAEEVNKVNVFLHSHVSDNRGQTQLLIERTGKEEW
jgi:hypothetical protein